MGTWSRRRECDSWAHHLLFLFIEDSPELGVVKSCCSRGSARLVFSPPPSLFARFSTAFLSALTRGSSLASFHPSFVLDFSLDEGDFNLMFLSALDIFYLDSLVLVVCICLVIYRMFTLSLCSFTEIVPLGNLRSVGKSTFRWEIYRRFRWE